MKIVINRCFGGFGLSHKATLRYAELAGIKLFSFVDTKDASGRINLNKHRPYQEGEDAFCIHYSTKPLKEDGTYEEYWSISDVSRSDPLLVQVVEEMGEESNGDHAKLKIVEIPDGIEFEIDEYDGLETIDEAHRSWS